jgi:preprotein translocase subunit YajC
MSYSFLIIIVAFIALIYFMMIRPQKKRMDEQKALVESLQPGTRVLLNCGIIGSIRAVGDAQLVVELAPGTEVTVLKQVIVKTIKPDEEEFEYSDDADQIADGPDMTSFEADLADAAFAPDEAAGLVPDQPEADPDGETDDTDGNEDAAPAADDK